MSLNYVTGTSGTVTLSSNMRLQAVYCHATTAGSIAFGNGPAIPVPAGASFDREWNQGDVRFVLSQIVFTGTDSYYVEYVV